MTREALKRILVDMIQRNSNRLVVVDYETTIDYILALAQPEYLSGCLAPSQCQHHGRCSVSLCDHYGKVVRPRMCVEPKQDGILYPKVGADV